jgi:hypothetical protein
MLFLLQRGTLISRKKKNGRPHSSAPPIFGQRILIRIERVTHLLAAVAPPLSLNDSDSHSLDPVLS